MATNNFKAFALDPNANVTSQADWEALPARLSGFTSGKASSAQVNKAIRQASFITASLAQFVSNKTNSDVLDDGDQAGFIAKLTQGFAAQYLSRSNPFADIASDGAEAVATALSNLNLGEAAKRGVGIGTSQLPDMSFFQSTKGSNGIQYLPGGIIIQWGIWQLSTVGNYNAEAIGGITWYTHYTKPLYTVAFPNVALVNFMGLAGSTFENQSNEYNTFVRSNMSAGSDGKAGSRTNACVSVTSRILGYTPTVHWLAIGY